MSVAEPLPDPTTARAELAALAELAAAQAGVVSRAQLRELGIGRRVVRTELRARRWRRIHPKTYVTFTGPAPPLTRVWAAILYAGRDAIASHETAAWLHRLRPDLPPTVEVSVPHGRLHRGSRPGVRVWQRRRWREIRQPAQAPPRTRFDQTVLDLTDTIADPAQVVDLVLRVCQRRLTTAARLRQAVGGRARLRHRQLIKDLLADVVDGVMSELERRYLRDVERAHGLPRGQRNEPEGPAGRRRYRDVRYRRFQAVVELDGRAAHPDESRERDDLRDNDLVTEENTRTLRYGWRSVTARPCETAVQVVRLLRIGGWRGSPHPCGPDCRAGFPGSDGD